MGAMNIGQASPYVEAFAIARAAAAAIFTVIDRIPEIDSFSDEGAKPINTNATQNNNVCPTKDKIDGNILYSEVNGHQETQEMKSGGWMNSGDITFDNVFFNYPSRPEVQVVQKFYSKEVPYIHIS